MKKLGHHIGGELVSGSNGKAAPVFNPATGQETKQVTLASKADVDRAVASAKDAFPSWANTTPMRRARVMFRYLELLEKHKSDIAALITEEHGKVLSDAAGEVMRGVEIVERLPLDVIDHLCTHTAKRPALFDDDATVRASYTRENGVEVEWANGA